MAICCADPAVAERLEQILGKDHGIAIAANVDEPADLVALIEESKLDADSRTEAVAKAAQSGLVML